MGVSERLDEIELKQRMSKEIFFKLNKEIRKIQKFINKYCSDPDAPNACWPDYRGPDYRGGFRKENRGKSEEKRNTKLENVKNHAVAVNFNSCICIYEFKNRRFVIIQ